ncbi:MAG: MarR family winged helix-turn-helix transcriptional regulator [Solirubrobacterales bacterium]
MATGNISAKGGLARETWGLLTGLVYPPPFLEIAREHDLRPATFGALRALEQPRTMGELARMLHCDNSNVTGIVDSLEDKVLAVRKPSVDDRRIKVVELSGQGEALLKRLSREVAKPPAWVEDLSPQDQKTLRDILARAADGHPSVHGRPPG